MTPLTDKEMADGMTRFGAAIERAPELDLPAEDGLPEIQAWQIIRMDYQTWLALKAPTAIELRELAAAISDGTAQLTEDIADLIEQAANLLDYDVNG